MSNLWTSRSDPIYAHSSPELLRGLSTSSGDIKATGELFFYFLTFSTGPVISISYIYNSSDSYLFKNEKVGE